ncbi:hypothetical protein DL98DRAFT_600005 [Cadophora sp. DSE1049]|nr:hypothetical protein DL98DRAFT_600005 [Cadophora sp. DSE1049]
MRAFLSPDCSTRQNITLSDHTIEAHCEDPEDEYTYGRKNNLRSQVLVPYYRSVMSSWAVSISLNTGISNANSTLARLLSQLILDVPKRGPVTLSALTPSLAEALSVMSCFMLSKGSIAATARHFWNHTNPTLDPGVWEPFSVSVTSQQYASGPSESWQDSFYLVLALMFVGNVVCLVYFLVHMGLVMDFTESQNSFALAINSPFSENLSGSCGGGPQGRQLKLQWKLKKDEDNHYYLKEEEDGEHKPLGYELRRRVDSSMRADGVF